MAHDRPRPPWPCARRLGTGLLLTVTAWIALGAEGTGVPSLQRSQPVPTLGNNSAAASSSVAGVSLPLQYEQDFRQPEAIRQFVFTDLAAWKQVPGPPPGLELISQSRYQPPVRSPVNLALIADRVFGDFLLECELMQTGREYGHRDMCLFFGFQNPTNFYYVHLATAADNNAHNIFRVQNAPRTNIARFTTSGVQWGLNVWHKVRLEHRIAEGTIRVWFDDFTRPVMAAEDRAFGTGYIGFGSFDDTGRIANIRIHGTPVEVRPLPFFQRAP